MRRPCGTLLLKIVEMASGRTYFYPFLTYCYVNLDVSLHSFLDRPDFLIIFVNNGEKDKEEKGITLMCMMVRYGKISGRTMTLLSYQSQVTTQ